MTKNITSDSQATTIARTIEALTGGLSQCAKCSAEANMLAKRGKFDAAVGTLAGIDVVLSESIALYRATLALHRTRRKADRVTANRHIFAGRRQYHR